MTADEGDGSSHQHHEVPAESDCAHHECPDCNSAKAVSCDTGALIPPSAVVKIDLEDDSPVLLAANSIRFEETSHLSTGPPGYLPRHPFASPISRYDTQIK